MRRLLLLPLLALPVPGCINADTNTAFDGCVVVMPDGGTDPNLVCDIAWSCNGDSAHYGLACSFQAGNFACTCINEGNAVKSFTVNPFTCDGPNALPALTAGCGWMLTTQ